MDMFLQETIGTERFLRPRCRAMHYVWVRFADETIDYLDENENLSPHRIEAREFSKLSDAEFECDILIASGFDASVETFQRYYH